MCMEKKNNLKLKYRWKWKEEMAINFSFIISELSLSTQWTRVAVIYSRITYVTRKNMIRLINVIGFRSLLHTKEYTW